MSLDAQHGPPPPPSPPDFEHEITIPECEPGIQAALTAIAMHAGEVTDRVNAHTEMLDTAYRQIRALKTELAAIKRTMN